MPLLFIFFALISSIQAETVQDLSCPFLKSTMISSLNAELFANHPISKLTSKKTELTEINRLILQRYDSIDRSKVIDFFSPENKKYYDILKKQQNIEAANKRIAASKLTEAEEAKLAEVPDPGKVVLKTTEEFMAMGQLRWRKSDYERALVEVKKNKITSEDQLYLRLYRKKHAKEFVEEKRFSDLTTIIEKKLMTMMKVDSPKKSIDYYSNYTIGNNSFELESIQTLKIKADHRQLIQEGSSLFTQLSQAIKENQLQGRMSKDTAISSITVHMNLDGDVARIKKSYQVEVVAGSDHYLVPDSPLSLVELVGKWLLPSSCPVTEETPKAAVNNQKTRKDPGHKELNKKVNTAKGKHL